MQTHTASIDQLIAQARHVGVWFPRDATRPDGVQIRLHRSAPEEGHWLADILRERRDEVNAYFAARRPGWPAVPDDGYGPRPDPDEPDAAVFLIRLEQVLFEDRVAEFVEQEIAYVQERIAAIASQAVAAHRRTASGGTVRPRTGAPTAREFRGGRVVTR